jgi:multidrug efflux pump subunit AcrA (membrane-fusion protein)
MAIFRKLASLVIFTLLLTSCGSIFGGSGEETSATPTPIPTPIVPEKPTYTVQRGTVIEEIEFNGRISPVEEVALYFESSGYVKQVSVDEGMQVTEGEVLAELEMDDLLKQLAQAQVSLNSVQLRLTEAENGLEREIAQADLNLTAAQARLTQAQNANADALAQAELALQVAQEQLARLQLREADIEAEVLPANIDLTKAAESLSDAEVEYQEALDRPWEREEIVEAYQKALRQAEWNRQLAQARYNRAIAAQETYQHDLRIQELAIDQVEAQIEQLQRGVDPALALEVQRAQQQRDWLEDGVDPVLINEVNQAQLALERLEGQVADAQIISPIAGEVMSASVFAGRQAEAFKPVIIIADPSETEVSAELSVEQLQELVEGQEVTASLNSRPDLQWQGTIRQLPYPYGSGGSSQELIDQDLSIHITLAGDLSRFRLGDLMRVTIILEQKDDVLWLPPQAIRDFQGRRFVLVQEGDRQRRVDVRVGIEGQERIEIEEGLEEGQVIVGQ